MYAPLLAAVVGGSTAAAGWSSPRPRPDQRLKMVCLNTRFTLGFVAYSVAYSVACSIPRCYMLHIGYILLYIIYILQNNRITSKVPVES